jgi:tetratricopeptide (TPR) repeat protein
MTTPFALPVLVWLAIASTQGTPTYESCVRAYQAGLTERALADIQARSVDNSFDKDVDQWIASARRTRRPADLEAALLLHTELFFVTWDATFPPALAAGYSSSLSAQAALLRRLHGELVSYGSQTPFLRTWYLLWESFMQVHSALESTAYGDYIGIALHAFPDDSEVLLATGDHFEMRWWSADDNPQRHPTFATGSAAQNLRVARDWFRKAVSAPRPVEEARVRLGRVLLALGDVEGAVSALRPVHDSSSDPGLRYLAALFLGAVYEQRGDLGAAAKSYAEAATLVPSPQSARLASAYVSHLRGDRSGAADTVVTALADRSDYYDPWLLYTRGYSLQFGRLRKSARDLVKAAASEPGR